MRIIPLLIGKKKLALVSGLVWHPLQRTGSARAKEIIGFAKESSFDFKVIRGTDSAHVGFGQKSDGVAVGQISAAAVIADALVLVEGNRNFLMAVELPDEDKQFMFVSAHEGVILADGDMVGTEEEIRAKLTADSTYGGWSAIICPDSWGVSKSVEKDFYDFFNEKSLSKSRKWETSTVFVDYRKVGVPIVLGVLVIGSAFFGANWWKQGQLLKLEQLRLINERLSKSEVRPPPEPVKPWPTLLKPETFVAACGEALTTVGVTAGNWRLSSLICTIDGMAFSWTKPNETAWISHLQAIRPGVKIADDGLSASLIQPLRFQMKPGPEEVLPPSAEITLRYYDLASRYGMDIHLDRPVEPPAPAPLPGQTATQLPPAPPPFWVEMPIQIKTIIKPVEAIEAIDYPGLRIQKISYANTSGFMQYTLTGFQYARR